MLCTIFYIENSNRVIFSDPKKRVKNHYFLNNTEDTKTVTVVQSLLLSYQNNFILKYQPQGVGYKLMSTRRKQNGDDEGEEK